jgi:hypothetical protein
MACPGFWARAADGMAAMAAAIVQAVVFFMWSSLDRRPRD